MILIGKSICKVKKEKGKRKRILMMHRSEVFYRLPAPKRLHQEE
jgi:hypothetical protein